MRGSFKSLAFRYGISIVLFAAVIGLSLVLRFYGVQINLTGPIIVAVVGSAWFGGRGPGILISVLIVGVSLMSARNTDGFSALAIAIQFGSTLALLILVVVLVSGRRTAQEKARRHSELFETTLASIGDAVIATDAEGKITFLNPIAERILEVEGAKGIGTPLSETYRLRDEVTGENIGDVFQMIKDRKEIVSFTSGLLLLRPNGSEIPISDSAAPILDSKGQFYGSVVVFQDDTARRESDARLMQSEQRRQQSQKLEAIGTLTGGVAHDFNNLLTAILGYTQLSLRKLSTSSPIHQNLVNVEQAGNRAAELTKKLLTFSRQQNLERRVIDLNESISEMLKLLERVIGESIKVTFKPSKDLKAVFADPTQIEQIIMNLSLNARDAMPKGGRLVIETLNVVLDEYYCRQYPNCVPGEYIQILVSDTGQGMDRDVLDRIFEPFFTTKTLNEGTGLGLSMVYGIVKQHKGHINVYSEPAHGTTFKVYIPVVSDEMVMEARTVQPELSGGNETILVADDEETLRNLSTDILGALGYTVITAEDGDRAVDLYSKNSGSIDLLLLDVVMPVAGGLEAYNRIKSLGGQAPVIFMTGYSSEAFNGSTANFMELDSYSVIQKPYTLDGLGRIVRDVLDRAHISDRN